MSLKTTHSDALAESLAFVSATLRHCLSLGDPKLLDTIEHGQLDNAGGRFQAGVGPVRQVLNERFWVVAQVCSTNPDCHGLHFMVGDMSRGMVSSHNWLLTIIPPRQSYHLQLGGHRMLKDLVLPPARVSVLGWDLPWEQARLTRDWP